MDDSRVLLAREHDPNELRRMVKAGELVRVRRGAFVREDDLSVAGVAMSGEKRLALDRISAVHRQSRAAHVVSHESAGLLWGLRLWSVPTVTHLRQRSTPGGGSARDIARHVGVPVEHAEIDGIPVTTLAQTVLDILLTVPPLEALVVADSALAMGLRVGQVRELLDAVRKPNGKARAALVLDLADGGAESAWETWLRYLALHAGLPRPQTQLPVMTHLGRFRVDLGWPEHRVLAEFDGQIKYADGAFGRATTGRAALVEEKRREDAIAEALGVRPVRFMAADARRPRAAIDRLLARFPRTLTAPLHPNRRLPLPSRR